MNGAECCVKHIQFPPNNQTFPRVVWVQFENEKVGQKHKQNDKYAYTQNIEAGWVPIFAIQRDFNVRNI